MKADNALETLLNSNQAVEGTVQSRQKWMAPDLPPGVLHPKRLFASDDNSSKSPVVTVSLM